MYPEQAEEVLRLLLCGFVRHLEGELDLGAEIPLPRGI